MQIVIDIPKETYKRIKGLVDANYFEHDINGFSQRAIANGKPLPEHHGRLIDADRINLHNISPCDDEMLSVYGATVEDIEESPTVIEAESENKE